ncbi:hypothetical protein JTB14_034879 [Gonioctena quinquepunctata]|nr:hypothetical protein JTB14_034879 [Gonioctena quinquepunctata]
MRTGTRETLRENASRDYPGYVYTSQDVKDEYEFTFQHIVIEINPPVEYRRGLLKFEIRVAHTQKSSDPIHTTEGKMRLNIKKAWSILFTTIAGE